MSKMLGLCEGAQGIDKKTATANIKLTIGCYVSSVTSHLFFYNDIHVLISRWREIDVLPEPL
jgi:hypothetical protein